MAEFPYISNAARLKTFFHTIQTRGVPARVTLAYLESIDFKSKNDRPIRGLLRFLGFTASSNVPTERWKAYRSRARAPRELGSAIREGYSALFKDCPDAHRSGDQVLTDFFRAQTDVGERAVEFMVRTFKTLCELAEFAPPPDVAPPPQPPAETAPEKLPRRVVLGEQGITINVNIQLTLPDTKDETLYDRFFESLKKHLLQ